MGMDWIKVRRCLRNHVQVVKLAEILNIQDRDVVVGKLVRFWLWVTENTTTGKLKDMSIDTINVVMEMDGFGEAMLKVGWMKVSGRSLKIPDYDRHMSYHAAARAGEAARKALQRQRYKADSEGVDEDASSPDTCPDNSGTRARANPDREATADCRESQRSELSNCMQNGMRTSSESERGRHGARLPQLTAAQGQLAARLAALRHEGEPVFDSPSAAAIALHPNASEDQLEWAEERLRQATEAGKAPRNPAGFVRDLIEKKQMPRKRKEALRLKQLQRIAEAARRNELLRTPTPVIHETRTVR